MKDVLITGASSGIGRASAVMLAQHGYRVFAGVRKLPDASGLDATPVLLEVTDRDSVRAAVRFVEERTEGLHALVNNAGIGSSGPLEFQELSEIERVFAVNVFGLIAVTQAFLPLIRAGEGRVVNIGSIGDRFSLPFGGALCSSKAAVRSLTESLRLELHPHGIHVVLIQPASVSTPAVDKFADEARDKLSGQALELYGTAFKSFIARGLAEEKAGSPPEVIADAVFEAVSATRPRTRYLAGKKAQVLAAIPYLPDRWQDALKLLALGFPLAFGAYQLARRKGTQGPSANLDQPQPSRSPSS